MGTSKGNYGRKMYSDPIWKEKVHHQQKLEKVQITKKCNKCGETFIVFRKVDRLGNIRIPSKEKENCSRKCANSHKHSEVWKSNIGNSLRKPPIENICKICGITFLRKKKQHFCSRDCVNKNRRLILSRKKQYRFECRFKFNVYDFPEKFDLNLILKYGWYSAKNHGDNMNGISRDHMYSINDGFKNNIPSHMISHPANCKLLPHSDNLLKMTKSSITIDELLERIKVW